jgi:hypothetical protein
MDSIQVQLKDGKEVGSERREEERERKVKYLPVNSY